MITSMTLVRKTVTLDADAVAAATEFSGGNLSAYVNEALTARVKRDHLRALVEEDLRRRGPIDPEVAAWVDESLDAVLRAPYPGTGRAE